MLIITDEADTVLNILAKKETSQEITDADWQNVFQSEAYVRLKKRELAFKNSFEDDEVDGSLRRGLRNARGSRQRRHPSAPIQSARR